MKNTTRIALLALAPFAGCAAPADLAVVDARGELVDRRTQAIAVAAPLFVNGTYTDCTDRTGNWSLALGAFGGQLDNDALSVVKDDVGCVLTATAIVTGDASDDQTWVRNTADPSIALGESYAADASSFASGAFYANALISDAAFADDFTMTVMYSNDPDLDDTGSEAAEFMTESATATANGVPAPDYAIDVSGLTIQTDAAQNVEAAGGDATLSGDTVGDEYIVFTSDPGTTHAALETSWAGGTPTSMATTLGAAAFQLSGASLSTDVLRYLVIANEVAGVRSYQVLTITFHGAT